MIPSSRMYLAVWLLAVILRLLHNHSLLADPLYYHPLGGNVPLLDLAQRIAAGDLLPIDTAFTQNSPGYPYLVAVIFKLFGDGSYYAVRVVGSLVDAGTCVLVAALARRHFGPVAGWAAGISLAVYGPLIFFAADLNPVPFTLFFLTLGIVLLDGGGVGRRFGAGAALGVAVLTRPDLLVAGLAAVAIPLLRRDPGGRRAAAAVALGLAVGVAPLPAANALASGRFTLLTLSGGHTLYIGHNPEARPQYHLPTSLDGDVFETMRDLAQQVERRTFTPHEVSPYYTRKALRHIVENPAREASLLARRALLLVNDFEATTYANPYYQRAYSPVLRWAPTFALLFALAAPGMALAWRRRTLHLWIPVLAAGVAVLAFFYIARLRIVMVPALAVFAGAALAAGVGVVKARAWRSLALPAAAALLAGAVSLAPLLRSDTSNEWNKAGGVLRLMQRYEEAEAALLRAVRENPANPNSFLNLSVLFRETGRPEQAAAAEEWGRELLAAAHGETEAFRAGVARQR